MSGWYNEKPPQDGHRRNILDPRSTEVGVGYYVRTRDNRGYVVQDFGVDENYPPVVIENEAIATASAQVNLYIYNRPTAAQEMLVSNSADFAGASWEPFATEKRWTLNAGTGWRTVYVKTRDAAGQELTVSDVIYLGTQIPYAELGQAQLR